MVVDECHRATGKADIVAAVAHMARAKCRFRVLGLSATPGSSREAVQVAARPRPRLFRIEPALMCMRCA